MGDPPMTFFLRKWAPQKNNNNNGQRPFFGSPILGAHDPYIPSQEPQMPPGLEPKSAPMGG